MEAVGTVCLEIMALRYGPPEILIGVACDNVLEITFDGFRLDQGFDCRGLFSCLGLLDQGVYLLLDGEGLFFFFRGFIRLLPVYAAWKMFISFSRRVVASGLCSGPPLLSHL